MSCRKQPLVEGNPFIKTGFRLIATFEVLTSFPEFCLLPRLGRRVLQDRPINEKDSPGGRIKSRRFNSPTGPSASQGFDKASSIEMNTNLFPSSIISTNVDDDLRLFRMLFFLESARACFFAYLTFLSLKSSRYNHLYPNSSIDGSLELLRIMLLTRTSVIGVYSDLCPDSDKQTAACPAPFIELYTFTSIPVHGSKTATCLLAPPLDAGTENLCLDFVFFIFWPASLAVSALSDEVLKEAGATVTPLSFLLAAT
mmetsp:Transcript_16243/g.25267  ORF Transcript_16243/g.25267 Transcript_16243/m.25267 type:complete len:255 (+) Transcript_16243:800-1564(+)